jgi:ATP-dependent RNA helicase SUPV3L1/SUV3
LDWKDPRIPEILKAARRSYLENGKAGVFSQLKFALQGDLADGNFKEQDIVNHARFADLRYPYEWYPATRVLQRQIHLHVGPTNSGKTYHALKRLEHAKTGIYAGPLRLLAHEVYTRLNAKGKLCNLVTGDERILPPNGGAMMTSCTVEMVPTHEEVEVAVIDEIQMIGHYERGWAWTQALLSLKAQEVHLCGEVRAVPLIKDLVAAMGDTLEIHCYERLSPLSAMSTSLGGSLKRLRKGDCVVAFSRRGIHALKKEIEVATNRRVAVVYGSLPPETRAQQARLFNDPDNAYDILVASDAIGMGLNL